MIMYGSKGEAEVGRAVAAFAQSRVRVVLRPAMPLLKTGARIMDDFRCPSETRAPSQGPAASSQQPAALVQGLRLIRHQANRAKPPTATGQ